MILLACSSHRHIFAMFVSLFSSRHHHAQVTTITLSCACHNFHITMTTKYKTPHVRLTWMMNLNLILCSCDYAHVATTMFCWHVPIVKFFLVCYCHHVITTIHSTMLMLLCSKCSSICATMLMLSPFLCQHICVTMLISPCWSHHVWSSIISVQP